MTEKKPMCTHNKCAYYNVNIISTGRAAAYYIIQGDSPSTLSPRLLSVDHSVWSNSDFEIF